MAWRSGRPGEWCHRPGIHLGKRGEGRPVRRRHWCQLMMWSWRCRSQRRRRRHMRCRSKANVNASWPFDDRIGCLLLLAHLRGFSRLSGSLSRAVSLNLGFGPLRVTRASLPVESSPMIKHGLGPFGVLRVGDLFPSGDLCRVQGLVLACYARSGARGRCSCRSTAWGWFNGRQVSCRAGCRRRRRGSSGLPALGATRRTDRWYSSGLGGFRSRTRAHAGTSPTAPTSTSPRRRSSRGGWVGFRHDIRPTGARTPLCLGFLMLNGCWAFDLGLVSFIGLAGSFQFCCLALARGLPNELLAGRVLKLGDVSGTEFDDSRPTIGIRVRTSFGGHPSRLSTGRLEATLCERILKSDLVFLGIMFVAVQCGFLFVFENCWSVQLSGVGGGFGIVAGRKLVELFNGQVFILPCLQSIGNVLRDRVEFIR